MKRPISRLLLLGSATLLSLLAVELTFRLGGLDGPMINRSLYYQESDVELYRPSADPVLLYELKPGARRELRSPGRDPSTASVNQQGARGPEPALSPERDSFRVLFFGASTLFGAGVSDQETLPAVLERELGLRGHPAEVWNFGTSGYTASQMIHLAANRLRETPSVELCLVMPTNQGRRPFLGGPGALERDHSPYFRAEPVLYAENFPPPEGFPIRAHEFALWGLASYRYGMGWYRSRARLPLGNAPVADSVTRREALLLTTTAQERNIPWYTVFYPRQGGGSPPRLPFDLPPERVLDLQREHPDPAFYEIHPPAEILALHAANLATELISRGIVPASGERSR